jgi:hypothetical protein
MTPVEVERCAGMTTVESEERAGMTAAAIGASRREMKHAEFLIRFIAIY